MPLLPFAKLYLDDLYRLYYDSDHTIIEAYWFPEGRRSLCESISPSQLPRPVLAAFQLHLSSHARPSEQHPNGTQDRS